MVNKYVMYHHSTYVKKKWSYCVETVQSLKSKCDLDLWLFDPKSNRRPPWVMSIHVWSIIIVCQKEIELSCGNGKKFKVRSWPWPIDPKINRGPPRVMVNKYHCIKKNNKWSYHVETVQSLKFKYDLDLLTQKSIEVVLGSRLIHVWSIIYNIVCQKEINGAIVRKR